MGIVVVALFNASGARVPDPAIRTSGRACASSVANSASRSCLPSADRYSKIRFRPSMYPSSRSRCLRPFTKVTSSAGRSARKPIRQTLPACCASTSRGAANMPLPTIAMNARRSISLRSCTLQSLLRSPDDLVGSNQERLRDCQAQRLGGLEVDHQLELRRLFDREVGGFGPFQNLVHVRGCPTI